MKALTRNDIAVLMKDKVPCLDGKLLYILGGGNTAQLYQEGLIREGMAEKIEGYCVNNPSMWGKELFGKKCLSPDSLKGRNNVLVMICTPQPKYIHEMNAQLDELGIEHCLLEEAVLKNHSDEVLQVYDLLFDQKSRDVYANMLYCRLMGVYPTPDLITENQYFCWADFTSKDIGSSFVDCGAYVGDSLERYVWARDGVVDKIFAFEPYSNNYRAMQHRFERLKNEWNLTEKKISLYPCGVSDKSTEGIVEKYTGNNGLGSKVVQGVTDGERIKIVALDDIISERIDFLKADIESYEYKMLLGAENTIRKYRPNIAVCIYHNSIDFYSVPLLVHRMMTEANIAVRHHSNTLADTVLYAFA